MSRLKILLVDDDQEILDFIGLIVSTKYDVITATDGVEALDLIKSEKPDIIISDMVMPRLDGLSLCQMLKSDNELKEIPFIMITASTYESDLPDGFWRMGAGSDGFITKPFEAAKIMEVIENIIRKKILKLDLTKHNGKTGYM